MCRQNSLKYLIQLLFYTINERFTLITFDKIDFIAMLYA